MAVVLMRSFGAGHSRSLNGVGGELFRTWHINLLVQFALRY